MSACQSETYQLIGAGEVVSERSTNQPKHFLWRRSLGVFFGTLLIAAAVATLNLRQPRTTSSFKAAPVEDCGTEYEVSDEMCNDYGAPVVQGVDVVMYFSGVTDGVDYISQENDTATLGTEAYQAVFAGYTFYFSSQETLELFTSEPSRYVPAFGGFCAFGLSGYDPRNLLTSTNELYTAPVDPAQYAIIDGALYLFRGSEAKELFYSSSQANIAGGTSTWASFFGDCVGFFNTECYMS